MANPVSSKLSLHTVLTEEDAAIRASRPQSVSGQIAALAFSGGGIRSATFCLGIIQSLARHQKLARFDFLSTVSGGGYIGSWLSALIKRRAGGSVEMAESVIHYTPPPKDDTKKAVPLDVSAAEDPAIQWLRRYSNYLTPRVGALGVDTWTAISTYTRNLTLNWLVLMPLLIAGILLVCAALPLAYELHSLGRSLMLAIATGALLAVALCIGVTIDLPRVSRLGDGARSTAVVTIGAGIGTLLTAWLGAVAVGIPAETLSAVPEGFRLDNFLAKLLTKPADSALVQWLCWILLAAVANTVVWVACAAIRLALRKPHKPTPANGDPPASTSTPDFDSDAGMTKKVVEWFVPMFASGALAGVLLKLWSDARRDWQATHCWNDFAGAAFDTAIGTPVVLVILSHAVLLFIGLAKRRMSESDREWLGRLGAILFLLGLGWMLTFGMLWLGAVAIPLADGIYAWLASIGVGAWLLQSLAAVLLGKSALGGKSGGTGASDGKGKPKLDTVLAVAPYIFVAGLVAAVGCVLFAALSWYYSPATKTALPTNLCAASAVHFATIAPDQSTETTLKSSSKGIELSVIPESTAKNYWHALRDDTGAALVVLARAGELGLLGWAALALVLAVAMSSRVDINLFSYNRFYGNRLARAYLGASRDCVPPEQNGRMAHPFTDIDPDDDLCLSALAKHDPTTQVPTNVQRPLHLINTALNLTGSPELAWQSRKSASFTFSPLHSGYAFPRTAVRPLLQSGPIIEAYRRTFEYGVMGSHEPEPPKDGIYNAGTTYAMAFPTSGAAASPNMGYHSTPSMALLLALFNVRLGRWFGNPTDDDASRQRTPMFSLKALLSELLGSADFKQPWLYLSDGGHFENLGIYELVRRRVPFIVVVDAGQDGDHKYSDLANAMRLVRTDFDVEITFTDSLDLLKPIGDEKISERGYVLGDVAYPASGSKDAFVGHIIYVKPTLLKGMPDDIVEYAKRGTGFPQEPTDDQWFSEAQFESYRRLGEFIGEALCTDPAFWKECQR